MVMHVWLLWHGLEDLTNMMQSMEMNYYFDILFTDMCTDLRGKVTDAVCCVYILKQVTGGVCPHRVVGLEIIRINSSTLPELEFYRNWTETVSSRQQATLWRLFEHKWHLLCDIPTAPQTFLCRSTFLSMRFQILTYQLTHYKKWTRATLFLSEWDLVKDACLAPDSEITLIHQYENV